MDEFKVLRKMALWGLLFVVVMVSSFGGCAYINQKCGLPSDNIIEELVEEVIEAQTGVQIDLTP